MTTGEWTDGDMRSLAAMVSGGDVVTDIAIVMGRSVDEVRRMADSLGLTPAGAGRGRSPGPAWTDHEKRTLREMWLAGRRSNEIARSLGGRTRNAVMGMVNRLGLMGRKEPAPAVLGGDFVTVYTEALDRLAPLGRDEVLGWDDDEPIETRHLLDIHEDVAFLMSVILHGKDPETIAQTYEVSLPEAVRLLRRLHSTGLWRDGEQRPKHWDEVTGTPQVLIMDAMVLGGLMEISGFPGEPTYRFPHAPLIGAQALAAPPMSNQASRAETDREAPFLSAA